MDTISIFSRYLGSLEAAAAINMVCLTTADTAVWVKDSPVSWWGQILR